MTPEIIIPPPLAFRNTSVFVKCNPNNIDFKKELSRYLKYKNVRNYAFDVYSVFGHAYPKPADNHRLGRKIKPYKDINNINFNTINTQYQGYNRGIDRCGVEVFYIRCKDGNTKQYVNVKNNGEKDSTFVGVQDLKRYCKQNGIKGYSKCTKRELVKLLMNI